MFDFDPRDYDSRDDDRFDVLSAQEFRYLAAVSADGIGALGSVWDTRGVAEIDDALIRQLPHDLADDGQSADSRVEDADGTLRHASLPGDAKRELGRVRQRAERHLARKIPQERRHIPVGA